MKPGDSPVEMPAPIPNLLPYLAACAVVALWVDFGSIHRDQHSDSILNVMVSLYRWTPFVWEQDRFGMLVPLLATPIRSPLANLLFQGFLTTFAGLATFFLLARYAFRDPIFPTVATIGVATLLALTPPFYRFEYLVDTSYGLGLSMALGGLILIESPYRGQGWLRLAGALALAGLAHWVNSTVALFLGPFVLLRGGLAIGPMRRRIGHSFACGRETMRARVEGLARGIWGFEATRAMVVLLAGFATGQALMELSPHHPTSFASLPASEWPDAWVGLIRVSWSALAPHYGLVPILVGAALALVSLALPGPRFPRCVIRPATALLATAVALWLLMGTRMWVMINNYEFRYLFPSALLGLTGLLGPAVASISGRLPSGPKSGATRAAAVAVALLMAATSSYGWPSLAGVRRDLDRKCGAMTDDLVASGSNFLAGDYWTVWVAVFHANMKLHDRGDPRVIWGVSYRSAPTTSLWRPIPTNRRLAAIPRGDGLGENYLLSYLFLNLKEVEARRTIRVFRPTLRVPDLKPTR